MNKCIRCGNLAKAGLIYCPVCLDDDMNISGSVDGDYPEGDGPDNTYIAFGVNDEGNEYIEFGIDEDETEHLEPDSFWQGFIDAHNPLNDQ